MEEAALGYLGEISQAASLRHAVQLLTPAHVLAKTNGALCECTRGMPHIFPNLCARNVPNGSSCSCPRTCRPRPTVRACAVCSARGIPVPLLTSLFTRIMPTGCSEPWNAAKCHMHGHIDHLMPAVAQGSSDDIQERWIQACLVAKPEGSAALHVCCVGEQAARRWRAGMWRRCTRCSATPSSRRGCSPSRRTSMCHDAAALAGGGRQHCCRLVLLRGQ